jgi:hypothetical protein
MDSGAMISWKIWSILRNPSFSHPLFRRTLIKRTAVIHEPDYYSIPLVNARFVIELLAAMFICSAMLSPIFLLLAAIALLLILNGTGYSLFWAVKTSGLIAQEREHQTYDLYCVSPEGALGVNWAICAGFLHRNGRLEQIHNLVRGLLAMALIMAGIVALVLFSNATQDYVNPFARDEIERSSILLVHVVTVIAIIYIDHIHSIVLGSLISIIVPTYAQRKIDSQFGTFIFYVSLQIGTYLLAWLVGLVILPFIYAGSTSGTAQISLAILQVGTFYAIREITIYALWQHLVHRLEGVSSDEARHNLSTFRVGMRS